MVNVNDAFEVHYKVGNNNFQVLVDFNLLKKFRENPDKYSVYDILADYKIYKNIKKGDLASEKLIKKIFGNDDNEEVLKTILLKGEAQVPSSYINQLKEEQKKKVINYIRENARNPQTNLPYTETMLSAEINKIKYNFDPKRDYKKDAEDVLKILKSRIPISMEKIRVKIEIPSKYVSNVIYKLKKYGNINKEFYDNEANCHIHMTIMLGKKEDLINFLKKNTHNEAGYFIEKI